MSQQLKRALLSGVTGKVRFETFLGRKHMVVPVVMLTEGVIWAVNSDVPELVLAEEFSKVPQQWDGRPVILDHPEGDDGTKISANIPAIVEEQVIGQLFYTYAKDNKLATEAWIDYDKAMSIPRAAEVVSEIEAGRSTEVSVGAYVDIEDKDGEWKDKEFHGVWRNIVSNHLAFLPIGVKGACSIEMGCGSLRSATVNVLKDGEFMAKETKSLRERLSTLMFGRDAIRAKDMTNRDRDQVLFEALKAVEPAAQWPEQWTDTEVVYAVLTDPNTWNISWWKRSYKLNADGSVELGTERTEMRPRTDFVAASADEATQPAAAATGGCKCKEHSAPTTAQGDETMTKAQKIDALIQKGTFKNEDRAMLEATDEKFIDVVSATATTTTTTTEQPTQQPTTQQPTAPTTQQPAQHPTTEQPVQTPVQQPVQTPEPKQAAPVAAQSMDQYLSNTPEPLRSTLQRALRAEATAKASKIATLKNSGRCKFTDDQLNAKSVEELDALVELAGIQQETQSQPVDFGGRVPAAPVTASENTDNAPPKPVDTYGLVTARMGGK